MRCDVHTRYRSPIAGHIARVLTFSSCPSPITDMTVDTPAGQLPARPRAYRPTLATYQPQAQGSAPC